MIGNTILQWTRPTFIRKPSAPNKDISSLQSYEVIKVIVINLIFFLISFKTTTILL